MEDSDVLVAGTQVGGCVIDDLVSVGGFGLVYRARRIDGRQVAIKVSKSNLKSLTAQHLTWQQNEIEALTKLKHPSLVEVLGFGYLQDGRLYFVMELVEGQLLSEYLVQKGRLDALEATRLVQRIAEALSACHAAKILHLDLKPGNIIVTDAFESKVKVLDFGLARAAGAPKLGDAPQQIAGTLAYIAPESWGSSEPLGPRADLYALGIIFYELLSGAHPFPAGAAPHEVIDLKRAGALAPLSDVAPMVPAPVAALVDSLLAADPAKRFPSAQALVERLRSLYFETLHGKPAATDSPRHAETPDDVPLVGRAAELDSLGQVVSSARGDKGRATVVLGDPGIGKSRLIAELLTRASKDGPMTIAYGRSRQLGELVPYSPLREALGQLALTLMSPRDAAGERARERAVQALRGDAAELRKLVPELGELAPGAFEAGIVRGMGADLVAAALLQLLSTVAAETLVVLVVEDIHWADEGTLAVLGKMAQATLPARVLLLCTSRPSPRLPSAPFFEQVPLGALAAEENQKLLSSLLGSTDSEALAPLLRAVPLLATGNPMVSGQIARDLLHEGLLMRDPEGQVIVSPRIRDAYRPPDSVYEAVERTLERLDKRHLEVLRVAAQIDRQFFLSDVEALGLFAPGEPLAALEAARADRLCNVEGDRWTFSHDTIREELAVRSEGLNLAEIHGRIATRLDLRDASWGTRAYHWELAGLPDRAAKAFIEAGLEADRLHDPIGATRMLTQAMALLPQLPVSSERDDLVTRAVYELVRIASLAGNASQSMSFLEKGAALVTQPTPEREMALNSAHARMYYAAGNFPKAVEYSTRCMALAKADPALRRYGFIPANVIGRALCGTGKFGPSVPVLTQACQLAIEAEEFVEQTHTEGILSVALAYCGDYAKAREHADTCRRYALKLGDPVRVAASYFYYATLAEAQFDWDEGARQTAELLDFAERNDIKGLYVCVGGVYAGRHQFHLGQVDRSRLLLTNTLNTMKQLGIAYGVTWAHAFLGDVELVANKRAEARTWYETGLTISNAGAKDEYAAPMCLIGLAHLTALEGGPREKIIQLADEAVARLTATSNVTQLAVVYQRYAEAMEEIGDGDAAAKWRAEWEKASAKLGVACDFWPRVVGASPSTAALPPRQFWRNSEASTNTTSNPRVGEQETFVRAKGNTTR